MSPIAVIILIIVILVVIAAVAWGVQASRRKKLQSTFGPEYDRVVADTGSRSDGEKELREREKRHAELELKPLSEESRAQYATAWEEVQIQFVDVPEQAVTTADNLVTRLIAERGYPTGDYDDQLANLSVEHARTLGHYRDAHDISLRSQSNEASTEDLRQALVHYRALFADLLGTDPVKTEATSPGTPTEPDAVNTNTANTGVDTDRADTVPAPRTPEADTRTTSTTSTPVNDTDVAGTRPDATSR
jgi:ribosomal protein L13E